MEMKMLSLNKFYPLNWNKPSITFGNSCEWGTICLSIYESIHTDNVDELEATDRIHFKELETEDGSDYVEGVYLDNKLIGSWSYPLVYNPELYKEIKKTV
jgi:hypothetical protein